MVRKPPRDVEKYLAGVPEKARATLEKIRLIVLETAPEATEKIAYGMPGFKYRGRPLLYIAAAKNHCGIYGPVPETMKDDLAKYDVSKGTIRFPQDKPPSRTLVRKLVKARMNEIEAAELAGKRNR
jgi:uncharacterized protein YdhG (YjbR/CyaY superfamily)